MPPLSNKVPGLKKICKEQKLFQVISKNQPNKHNFGNNNVQYLRNYQILKTVIHRK